MSKNVTGLLIGNYGLVRTVIGRTISGYDAFRLNGKYFVQCDTWADRDLVLREFSSQKSLPNSSAPASSSSSLLPKITALLSETRKFAPVAQGVIIGRGKSLFRQQWDAFFRWYDEFSHTNEVREAHRQVEEIQDKLNAAQQLRRDVSKELNGIRYEMQTCFADQANVQKSDPRYLELIRREIEISNREKQKNEEFNLLDKAERDLFILMQAAVKTSHEKEKIHTNSAKYWSIVGSLAGALLGICGTAFSFYNRNDLLSDINKEFVEIRSDTKSICEQVQLLAAEQRQFFDAHNQRAQTNPSNGESWIHWIGRHTYVISIYRYFVPKSIN